MQVELLNSVDLKKEFKVTIPFQEVNELVETKILEVQKDYQIPGFRKGSVPVSLIRSKVSKGEVEKVLHEKIAVAMSDIVKSYKLVPSSRPGIELINFQEGKEWQLKFIFELFPEIPEINWSEIAIEKIEVVMTDPDIQKAKDLMLKQFREFKECKGDCIVKEGDKVKADFFGKLAGENFEGNEGKDVEIIIGEGHFLKDFEDKCIGMKAGEMKDIDVKFPVDYPNKNLADQVVKFTITINRIFELEPLKNITKDILEKIGVESLEELDEKVKKRVGYDLVPIVRNHMKRQLFDILHKKYNFVLPQKMVSQDRDLIFADYEKNKGKYKDLQGKSEAEVKKEFEKIAKRRVKLGLIMANVSKKHNIKVEDNELQKIIQEQAERDPRLKNKILEFYKKPENFEKIKGPILEEKAFDYILTAVKIKDVKMKSEEFTKITMANSPV